jgi:hypothetical protein
MGASRRGDLDAQDQGLHHNDFILAAKTDALYAVRSPVSAAGANYAAARWHGTLFRENPLTLAPPGLNSLDAGRGVVRVREPQDRQGLNTSNV